jgi:2-polyprenyl-6-hydroxyphenyl methylase/3-demethylubiquinone-9 3-methyltransferase
MATAPPRHTTRFEFGANWRSYARSVDHEQLYAAQASLTALLGPIFELSFLDIGSGSGLFSAAARRLGAEVVSFDYDSESVRCTRETRDRFQHPDDDTWRITGGSALDESFMRSLGQFDIVYAWGVLHHTGRMWDALRLACEAVAPGGVLLVSLYNDQGRRSKYWRAVKSAYNALPKRLRPLLVGAVLAKWIPDRALGDLASHRDPLVRYRHYERQRGMSVWHDWIDWIGGYPFEVARPGNVFGFLRDRGFEMLEMRTTPELGCNEYLARRARE